MDRDEMLRVLRAFESVGLEYVLIGATAMGFHGLVRATEDVDLLVRATKDNVERLKQAFRIAYADDPHVDDIDVTDLLGDYPAIRYYPPSGDLYFDVMTRIGEAASFDTVESEVKEFEGTRVRVASPMALYRLKRSTIRPLDRRDAEVLPQHLVRTRKSGLAVQKFRSIEEMEAAPVIMKTEDGFERFLRHCARYWKLSPRRYPRGVFKFRTLQEAQAARDKVTADNAP